MNELKKLYIFILVFSILFPPFLYSSGWKISLGAGYNFINLKDLEAGLDFWNNVTINITGVKRTEGWNIPQLEKINGSTSYPAVSLMFEKEFSEKFSLLFGIENGHGSINPQQNIGNIDTDFYNIYFNFKETYNLTAPFAGFKFSPLKTEG